MLGVTNHSLAMSPAPLSGERGMLGVTNHSLAMSPVGNSQHPERGLDMTMALCYARKQHFAPARKKRGRVPRATNLAQSHRLAPRGKRGVLEESKAPLWNHSAPRKGG